MNLTAHSTTDHQRISLSNFDWQSVHAYCMMHVYEWNYTLRDMQCMRWTRSPLAIRSAYYIMVNVYAYRVVQAESIHEKLQLVSIIFI